MRRPATPAAVFSLALSMGVFGLGRASCEREGPVEQAGEEVDEALWDTGDAVQEAAEETQEKIEKTADKVEDEVN